MMLPTSHKDAILALISSDPVSYKESIVNLLNADEEKLIRAGKQAEKDADRIQQLIKEVHWLRSMSHEEQEENRFYRDENRQVREESKKVNESNSQLREEKKELEKENRRKQLKIERLSRFNRLLLERNPSDGNVEVLEEQNVGPGTVDSGSAIKREIVGDEDELIAMTSPPESVELSQQDSGKIMEQEDVDILEERIVSESSKIRPVMKQENSEDLDDIGLIPSAQEARETIKLEHDQEMEQDNPELSEANTVAPGAEPKRTRRKGNIEIVGEPVVTLGSPEPSIVTKLEEDENMGQDDFTFLKKRSVAPGEAVQAMKQDDDQTMEQNVLEEMERPTFGFTQSTIAVNRTMRGRRIQARALNQVFWAPSGDSWGWQDISMLPETTADALKEKIAICYESKPLWRPVTRYPETQYIRDICIGHYLYFKGKGKVIRTRSRDSRERACDTCIKRKRPCVWIVLNPGDRWDIGWYPLPETYRRGKQWTDVQFWIRE